MKKLLTLILLITFALNSYAKGMPKEYLKIKNTKQSKEYFFNYVYKLVTKGNLEILKERAFVKNLLSSPSLKLDKDSKEFKKLSKLKKKYRVKKLYDLKSHLAKIDVVPPSMALAQAAVESGWGKSRFTKQANNVFGHWTYNPKIGMLPKQRKTGAKHFIRIFKTLQASIDAYMLNLNRNNAYKSFHKKRYSLRTKNLNPSGLILSQTMLKYSGIGKEYLKILRVVIKKNKLEKYDDKFYTSIKTNKDI
jgi:Bax protein